MHTNIRPTAGPSSSSATTPGSRRRRRAPSSTTRISGRNPTPSLATAARRSTRSTSSAIRRPVASSSAAPAAVTGPPSRRTCGSQRVHVQDAVSWSASTNRSTSAGECIVTTWATIQAATGPRVTGLPATPVTLTRASGTPTGTSAAVQCRERECSSRAGSSSVTSLGTSAVPTRATIQSGSFGRRSHSRARGPVANSSTAAGSGLSRRRSALSATRASWASCSTRRRRAAYSAQSSRNCRRPDRRVDTQLAPAITGDSAMNASM